MSVAADPVARTGLFSRVFGAIKTLILGTLLCLSAPTSLIVLGWLMRRMRFVAFRRAGMDVSAPGWFLGDGTGLKRWVGGFAANIREGVMAAFSLVLATAPFTVIWLLSWWAGWENSFSKGYEQAFVGPLLGLGGVVIFCWLMIWLPLALAHQAVENRVLALFEWRMVRSAVRHTGWGYVFFAAVSVIFALPLFAGRGLVTFASGLIPGFDEMTAEQAAKLAGGIDLALAAYIFIAHLILRGWSARIYANAVARALDGPDAELWRVSPLAAGRVGGRRSWRLTHWMRAVLLSVIWFGLAAQIFVGQFLNHDWHLWVTHPFLLLPWAG
ncbi:MAG: hypothetical protein AAGK71_12165 [Pseudomonadota bacterium]